MKLFHLLSGAPYGGVERQIERFAAVFEQNGIEQRALLAENPNRAGRLAAIGVIPIEAPLPGRFAFLDRRRINGALRRFAPDAVISWTPDMAAMVEPGEFRHVGRLGMQADLGAFARCDSLFTPGQARADAAKAAGWSPEKVKVLPHLPRADTAAPAPVTRKAYFTPPTAKLIVTAMRLKPDCGLEVLLDAVSRLSGYYLWIAGDGEHRAAYEQMAHERGVKPRVRFLGWHEDLTPFIAAADVFAYSARQDDVGDAVIEAWDVGVPVVAADSLGPGLLIRHQENAMLVPVGDAVSMAEAVKWVAQDRPLASRLAEAGHAAFLAQFAADKVVPQYLDFFNQIAGKAQPDPQPGS